MPTLEGKKIILAVTGGIAAYKSVFLVRLLIKQGAEVKVILSPEAKDFVSPLTLATLSKNPVVSNFTDSQGNWYNHVELGLWADLLLIAPLTARTLSNLATGNCTNFLLATYLSAKCPTMVAPAMDLDMYRHPTTQNNLQKITQYGNIVLPAAKGELASGLVGEGRMQEPEEILYHVQNFFSRNHLFSGKNILVSAGPTYEAIDPVRFIGNHSSGKMGFALAEKAAQMGANVTLVSGPSQEKLLNPSIQRINVTSAQEMLEAIDSQFAQQDVVIMAAAVADYRPKQVAEQKIKKKTDEMAIELVKNPDILHYLGTKKGDTFLVGFALETQNALENAKGKLKRKNADLIVLNSLEDKDAGFGKNTNKVTFITKDEKPIHYIAKPKIEVAEDILKFIAQKI